MEALVSLTILIITTTVASSTVISAMQSVALSRDYLVAQNLADEAIEIVKNIRNTNSMISSISVNECWTVIDPGTDCSIANNKLTAGNHYIPILKDDSRWKLEDKLAQSPINSNFQIYKKEIGTPGSGIFSYTNDGTGSLTPTNYYRYIKVLEENTDSVLIEVKVWWYTGAKVNELKGLTLITNHE